MVTVTFDLVGTAPMIPHNGRLANPMDYYTQQLKELTGIRKKTADVYSRLLAIEARGSCYETADGVLGLPLENVWKAIHDAAKKSKRGEDVKRALLFESGTVLPLLVTGETVTADAYAGTPENLIIRTVVVQGRRVLRARPLVRNWSVSGVSMEVCEDILNPSELGTMFEYMGKYVGLGDWRPLYGRFTVENVSEMKQRRAA